MQDYTTRTPMALVLRNTSGLASGTRKISAADYETWCTAEATIAHAKEVLAQAESVAEEMRAKYREEGLALGREDAQEETLTCVADFKGMTDDWIRATREDILELVNDCVREVVDQVEVSVLVREAVEKGIARFVQAQQINIVVHPDLAEGLNGVIDRIAHDAGIEGSIRIVKDASKAPKDILIDTPMGCLDMSVDKRIEFMAKQLRGEA